MAAMLAPVIRGHNLYPTKRMIRENDFSAFWKGERWSKHHSRRDKFLKRELRRARRRAEKRDPENVPIRFTLGYAD